MTIKKTTDIGDTVICDQCNKDYTESEKSGGFIFGSHAYCPECAREALPRIKGYGEEDHIKAQCPDGMSFKNFVLAYRGGNNSVTVITLEDGESFKDLLFGKKR